MRLRQLALGLFWSFNGRDVNASPVPSDETLLDSLVLVSVYLFPNQSSLETAVNGSSWQRYNNVDASSYWSTGKQNIRNTDVSIQTYAYTSDELARRDDDKKNKRNKLIGIVAGVGVPTVGGAGYGIWKIHDKWFKTKPGVQPTGINVAGPSVPTLPNTPGIGPPNTIPPEILKPGTLENIITSHGTPVTPESFPPPTEPLWNGAKPPTVQPAPEINLPPPRPPVEPVNAPSGPVDPGSKPVESGNTPNTGESGKPIDSKPIDSKPIDFKPAEPQGPPSNNRRPKTPWERVKDKAGREAEESRRAKEADERKRKQVADAERQRKKAEQKAKNSGQADDAKKVEEAKKAEEARKIEQAETAKEAKQQADEAQHAADEASKLGEKNKGGQTEEVQEVEQESQIEQAETAKEADGAKPATGEASNHGGGNDYCGQSWCNTGICRSGSSASRSGRARSGLP
jgi:hypothetical protein